MKLLHDALSKRLDQINSRAKSSQSAAARIYPIYQAIQTKRFSTENRSEGDEWPALKPEYAKYKLKKFASSPGAGKKMLIATSTLAGAVIGPGSPFKGTDKHGAIFKPYSLRISVISGGTNAQGKPFNYAEHVAKTRPFMKFSETSLKKMKDALAQYLIGQ